MATDLDFLMCAAKYEGARASAELELKTEGARKRWPERLWLQHGIARNGERESEARRGVQGVSSSAWLEIMKVWVGKMPLCQAGEKESGVVGDLERMPPFAWTR